VVALKSRLPPVDPIVASQVAVSTYLTLIGDRILAVGCCGIGQIELGHVFPQRVLDGAIAAIKRRTLSNQRHDTAGKRKTRSSPALRSPADHHNRQ
jgi:hypothetical protein